MNIHEVHVLHTDVTECILVFYSHGNIWFFDTLLLNVMFSRDIILFTDIFQYHDGYYVVK